MTAMSPATTASRVLAAIKAATDGSIDASHGAWTATMLTLRGKHVAYYTPSGSVYVVPEFAHLIPEGLEPTGYTASGEIKFLVTGREGGLGRATSKPKRPTCPGCGIVLPITGECDYGCSSR